MKQEQNQWESWLDIVTYFAMHSFAFWKPESQMLILTSKIIVYAK